MKIKFKHIQGFPGPVRTLQVGRWSGSCHMTHVDGDDVLDRSQPEVGAARVKADDEVDALVVWRAGQQTHAVQLHVEAVVREKVAVD